MILCYSHDFGAWKSQINSDGPSHYRSLHSHLGNYLSDFPSSNSLHHSLLHNGPTPVHSSLIHRIHHHPVSSSFSHPQTSTPSHTQVTGQDKPIAQLTLFNTDAHTYLTRPKTNIQSKTALQPTSVKKAAIMPGVLINWKSEQAYPRLIAALVASIDAKVCETSSSPGHLESHKAFLRLIPSCLFPKAPLLSRNPSLPTIQTLQNLPPHPFPFPSFHPPPHLSTPLDPHPKTTFHTPSPLHKAATNSSLPHRSTTRKSPPSTDKVSPPSHSPSHSPPSSHPSPANTPRRNIQQHRRPLPNHQKGGFRAESRTCRRLYRTNSCCCWRYRDTYKEEREKGVDGR